MAVLPGGKPDNNLSARTAPLSWDVAGCLLCEINCVETSMVSTSGPLDLDFRITLYMLPS